MEKELNKTQIKLLERVKDLKNRNDAILNTEFSSFTYNECMNYNRKKIIEKFPELKESYIEEKIDYVLNDSEQLTFFWNDSEESLCDCSLECLEKAEKKGYIEKGVSTFDGRTTGIEHNFDIKDGQGMTGYIKMKWRMPNEPEDLDNELYYLGKDIPIMSNAGLTKVSKQLTKIKRDIRKNELACQEINKIIAELNSIYSKGYDMTEEVIYRIEEDEEKVYKITPPPTPAQIFEFKKDLIKEVLYKKTGNNYTNSISDPSYEYHKTKRNIALAGDHRYKWTNRSQSREKFIKTETERYNIAKARYDIWKPLDSITDEKVFAKGIKKVLKKEEILKIINE